MIRIGSLGPKEFARAWRGGNRKHPSVFRPCWIKLPNRISPRSFVRFYKLKKIPFAKANLIFLATALGFTFFSSTCQAEEEEIETNAEKAQPAQEPLQEPLQMNSDPTEDSANYENFARLLLDELPLFLLATIAVFASSFIGIHLQLLVGKIIDFVKVSGAVGFTPKMLHFAAMVVIQSLLVFVSSSMMTIATERIAAHIRKQFFSHMLEMDIEFFDKIKVGHLLSRVDSDIVETRRCIKYVVQDGVKFVTQIIGGFVALVKISPQLTLLTALAVPVIVLVGTLYGRLLRYLSGKSRRGKASVFAHTMEKLQNIRTVRSFSNEEYEKERYIEEDLAYESNAVRFGLGLGIHRGLSTLAMNGLVAALLACGGTFALNGTITPGDLTSFLVTAMGFQKSLGQSSVLIGKVMTGLSSVNKIYAMINEQPKIPSHTGQIPPLLIGNIEFKDVSFSYPTRPQQPVFEHFDFLVQEGKTVALVGPSGSGKSTIVSLLMRFYDPSSGSILLDGVDYREVDPAWLRKQIGIVNQEPTLFHASIFENISYSNPSATYDEVMNAAKMAKCDEFITNFPNGYDTIVGDRGTQLSGGQKQRIAIARAILKNPKILILDEATSALDTKTEESVQAQLSTLMAGRTVLVIAHRLSTIRNSDVIAVLKQGTIAESGTHEQLMKMKEGIYRTNVGLN